MLGSLSFWQLENQLIVNLQEHLNLWRILADILVNSHHSYFYQVRSGALHYAINSCPLGKLLLIVVGRIYISNSAAAAEDCLHETALTGLVHALLEELFDAGVSPVILFDELLCLGATYTQTLG